MKLSELVEKLDDLQTMHGGNHEVAVRTVRYPITGAIVEDLVLDKALCSPPRVILVLEG